MVDGLSTGLDQTALTLALVLRHHGGLHARPAVRLTKLARSFRCQISLAAEPAGPWVDAKVLSSVLTCRVREGDALFIRALGVDAETALAAMARLVDSDFTLGPGDVVIA